jgi:hypothetical protein
MRVLNVGGGPTRALPEYYREWDQDLLDIDPNVEPDIVCDAKEMHVLPPGKYDAVYCSHSLEHFYKHEVPAVLAGFRHVLKRDGFAHIIVPDMRHLFDRIAGKDIDDTYYTTGDGLAITFHDVLYGWGLQVSKGNQHYCHKTGFTEKSLSKALLEARFARAYTVCDGVSNLIAYAFKVRPSEARLRALGG